MNKKIIIITMWVFLIMLSGCAAITGVETVSSDHKTDSGMIVNELRVTDLKQGNGTEAVSGLKVSVHYTGWLYDALAKDTKGTKFDSSHDRGAPFNFTLGKREVIDGWDKGVVGMKEGGLRRLTIPARLGYGRRGSGRSIPPNSTLVFDVELLHAR